MGYLLTCSLEWGYPLLTCSLEWGYLLTCGLGWGYLLTCGLGWGLSVDLQLGVGQVFPPELQQCPWVDWRSLTLVGGLSKGRRCHLKHVSYPRCSQHARVGSLWHIFIKTARISQVDHVIFTTSIHPSSPPLSLALSPPPPLSHTQCVRHTYRHTQCFCHTYRHTL